MNQAANTFNTHRRRLSGIAYRMLGSRADAEDVLQDAYIRWHESAPEDIRSAEAWLVTLVTRICIDRLRAAKTQRESYIGPWLPEPVNDADFVTPEAKLEFADDLSVAFLTLLERLTPDERAAFLLREVFDYDYSEVAQFLAKTDASCRQLVHRAKERVRDERRRFLVDHETHMRVLRKFMAAASSGNREHLAQLLAEDATLTADGGGKAVSTYKTLVGAERIAWLYYAVARNPRLELEWRESVINGQPGILRYRDGRLHSTLSIVTDGERVLAIYSVLNPDKLHALSGAQEDPLSHP